MTCFDAPAQTYYNGQRHVLCDPVAGEGTAIATLRDLWWPTTSHYVRGGIVACEMEPGRAAACKKRVAGGADQVVASDAFAVTWADSVGASLLYLNPPYDTDPDYGRLEQRFLFRFYRALAPGGALMFVIPITALAASARFLAKHFSEIRCWRFPDAEYEAYRQIVVIGRRVGNPLVDAPMAAMIEAWAKFPARLLPLPTLCPDPLRIPTGNYSLAFHRAGFDRIGMLQSHRPWEGMPVGIGDLSVGDLIGRQFPTALPPKPAHLALAMANGHFNGHRITADDPTKPPLLVKGMFQKELVKKEEKLDKEGEVKAIVKVEQPSLRMSALRLDSFRFFEPRPGAEPTFAADVEDCNMRDIIDGYSRSLGRLMAQQFPPLHNPARPDHQMRLPDLPRSPFRVQYHAIQAAIKLLATRRNPKFTAEVGTGKTTMALYVWAALTQRYHQGTVTELARVGIRNARLPKVRRMLVLCPPHLLDTWTDEITIVAPWARAQIVRSIGDLHDDADIYVLSRENAKLGHGFIGLEGTCPGCGAPLPEDAETNLAKRLLCEAPVSEPWNAWAYLAEDLAAAMLPLAPDNEVALSLTRKHRILRRRAGKAPKKRINPEAFLELMGHREDHDAGRATILSELEELLADREAGPAVWAGPVRALERLASALGEQMAVADALERIAAKGNKGRKRQWSPYTYAEEAAKNLRASEPAETHEERLEDLRVALALILNKGVWENKPHYVHSRYRQRLRPAEVEGEDESEPETCGEPLYQASPAPRRFPLARYITRHLRGYFDLLVLDEAHEFNNLGTAQEKAAHRLAEMNVPVLALTGSIMSGYASSLFANWWSLDRNFRDEFSRDDLSRFTKQYGYQKFIFTPRKEKREGYGKQSDHEEWSCRAAGEVPGVLPLFLLRYLLPAGVVVHKDELDRELPPMDEAQIPLAVETDTDAELLAEYRRISDELMNQIAADMFTPLSGKLWGAMMELPSYLDRCTVDQGPFEIRYPKECGGHLIAEGKLFPATYQPPKERALLHFLDRELRAGRRSMVFIRHVNGGLPDRLARLIRESGVTRRVVYLSAQRVPAPKRKKWITEHVVNTEMDVLIVNPNAVRTGLNNLIHFCNAWWHEIDYSAQTYRQANGREHRVGQLLPVHIRVPHYPNTAQAVAVDLVARKVTASLQVDGLSVQGALEAAGSDVTGRPVIEAAMAMGRAIYERLRGAAA